MTMQFGWTCDHTNIKFTSICVKKNKTEMKAKQKTVSPNGHVLTLEFLLNVCHWDFVCGVGRPSLHPLLHHPLYYYANINWTSSSLLFSKAHMFHSEILASSNFNNNKILSPGLENNHTLKCCFGNFPT